MAKNSANGGKYIAEAIGNSTGWLKLPKPKISIPIPKKAVQDLT